MKAKTIKKLKTLAIIVGIWLTLFTIGLGENVVLHHFSKVWLVLAAATVVYLTYRVIVLIKRIAMFISTGGKAW